MTKKKNIFRIVFLILIVLIVLEAAVLFIMNSKNFAKHSAVVGFLAETHAKVYINDVKIPSYGYDGRAFIAAEDLEPFGVTITSSLGNITLDFPEVKEVKSTPENLSSIKAGTKLRKPAYSLFINGEQIENFYSDKYNIIPAESLKNFTNAACDYTDNTYKYTFTDTSGGSNIIEGSTKAKEMLNIVSGSETSNEPQAAEKKVIVLDPGHGKSSGSMSAEEKEEYGWVYNSVKGQWGEWRHWKKNSVWQDCEGSGCNGRVTPNGACWYPMANGDRDKEPDINLQNCLAAKKYLEQLGYTVRLTRTSNNENPSITQRLKYCYPDKNTSAAPDAALFLCVHSNAGGGSGSAYITLEGPYDQKGISSSYADDGNKLGKIINDEIVGTTSLSRHGGGSIGGEPELIAFCKSPVTCGYLEIGFFDNASDLAILQSESDKIGKAIADGIDKYIKNL